LSLIKKCNIIGISLGDAAGIGPEVVYKALSNSSINKNSQYLIFGSEAVFEEVAKMLPDIKPEVPYQFYHSAKSNQFKFSEKMKGKISKKCGQYAVQWIKNAFLAYQKGEIDALVTAPINKEACHLSGFKFKGHTDFLASLCKSNPGKMMFYSKKIKVILVSHHLALKEAINYLSVKNILSTIISGNDNMKNLGIKHPLVLVSGLNPHASENGAFGTEEQKIIYPAIEKALRLGIHVKGPYPPDTIFKTALEEKKSIVVAMTHDQGLIPFKLLAFDSGVNITTGLPIIRTSPDHGTAFDIAWKGIASERSMIEAINLSIRLSRNP